MKPKKRVLARQVNEFSWAELISNESGKTSGSGFIGVISGIVGCVCFISGVVGIYFNIENSIDIIEKSLALLGVSALLLGARKFSKSPKIKNEEYSINESEEENIEKNNTKNPTEI